MPLGPLPEPASHVARLAGWLRGIAAVAFLAPTLAFANSLQILMFPVSFVAPNFYRSFNRWGVNVWWGWCVTWAEKINGTKVSFAGDKLPAEENAIVFANHQQIPDILALFSLARRKRRLGDLKWFAKDIIKYFPGFGWGLWFIDCIFVKRNWAADRTKINQAFDKFYRHRIPMWLMTFVEGTRLKFSKMSLSRQYAKQQGMALFRHVMVPRTKGFVASVQGLRGHVDAVYDVTIAYVDGVPTLWQWIKGNARQVHLHVRRFAMDEMPVDADKLSAWLVTRFEEKDRLLDYFYHNGVFPPMELPSGAAARVG